MEKEFKTVEEQIKILMSRNIIIRDYNNAYSMLMKNNYYYLVNGYKNLFLDTKSEEEMYKDNTKIEEIYALYNFDKKIRIVSLKYLLLIENEVKTYLAYEFSKAYGHKNYLISKNFDNLSSKNSHIQKFIDNVESEIQYQYKNSNEMIVHYLDKYNYIPLWVLVRILSFGKISIFYSLMKPREQNAICRKYNLKINDFKVILHNLTLIRNICAHDEKLYDVKLKNRIFSTQYHKKLNIDSKDGNYKFATRDLFSIVICFKLLLEKDDFESFYVEIINAINELHEKIAIVKIEDILSKMGFPKNYKKLTKLS